MATHPSPVPWEASGPIAAPSPEAVHVYRIRVTAEGAAAGARWLDGDERARAERYRFDRDRRQFVCARAGLRVVLGACLDCSPAEVRLAYEAHGKPRLAPPAPPLQFNLSHADALVLLAVAWGRRVGLDVEPSARMPDGDLIARRFFSPGEYAAWSALPPDAQPLAFMRIWTRKEAFLKATGLGVAALGQVEVTVRPDEPAALVATRPDPGERDRWTLCDLFPDPAYTAAVLVEGRDWHLRTFDFAMPA